MSDLFYKTATELGGLLKKREISSYDLTKAVVERTQAVEPKIKAFLNYDREGALKQAKASDERFARGESRGPLEGIPVGLKDIIAVNGEQLTCASKILEKFNSPYDATFTRLLKNAGAVLWGRLNMDEFAMGSSTENSAYQVTSNPWDLERIPGGSSGGSAACVAAGEAIVTVGSDTGGSIRQPASLCGVVGLKPTYGLVSRYGLVAYASSLDQIGPFARTVEDVAILLQVIASHDPLDSTSIKTEIPDYRASLGEKDRPWKLGVPREYFSEGLDKEVGEAIENAIKFFESKGCEICNVSLPHTDLAVPVYYIIATAEASSNLARYDGIRYSHRSEKAVDSIDLYFKSRAEGFGEEVKRRIILGTYVLSSGYYDAYYLRAQKVRTLIRQDFLQSFDKVDALLTPTSPTVAFKIGERSENPLAMYLSDIYTISVNLAGLPGISIPCGFNSDNMPIGLQIIGKPFNEADILAMAHKFERSHDFYQQHPKL